MKEINSKNNQRGAILLVVLLIMFGIVATTVSMAFIIISEIQQSRDVDYSIVAYYAGETAIEHGLFQMRKGEMAVDDLNSSGDTLLDNTASWTRTASNEVPQMSASLEKDKSLTVDFYNFDDPAQDPDLGSVKISGADDTAWLETTLLAWPVGTEITWGSQLPQNIFKGMFPLAGDDICLSEPAPNQAYQLRIKAFFDDIQDKLTITGWSADACSGELRNILGLVTMTGIGQYKHSIQAVQASLSRRAPLSGVWDYIVFGSEPITK